MSEVNRPINFQPEMSVADAIAQRHSVRSFTNESVGREAINILLKAAVRAPTAVHEEAWLFAVLGNRELLKRLSNRAKELMSDVERTIHVPGRHMSSSFVAPENVFYNAPMLIVIYAKTMGPFVVADCWLAAENLMLSACAMGLGTCVSGLGVAALNSSEWKVELGVPPDVTAIAPIMIGFPAGETLSTVRKDPNVFVWK